LKTLIALLAMSLAACAPAAPEVGEDTPASAEATSSLAALPGVAELQAAFDTSCPGQPKIATASCTALGDPTEFKCAYAQEGQDAGTTSETIIAKDADSFVLIDLPNSCQVQ
jgi:hypothetical protein